MKELLKYYETNTENYEDDYCNNIDLDKLLEELKSYNTIWVRKVYIRESRLMQDSDGKIYKDWKYLGYFQDGKYHKED